MRLTVTAPVVKQCPYVDERDIGTVTIVFGVDPAGDGPELHELARYLLTYADKRLSHEDFTRRVQRELRAVSVESTWTTAGMTVVAQAP